MEYVHLGNIDYDGSQLHHAFAYENASILGPSIVSFIGKAEVKKHLVDLEDKISNDFIKSKKMLHFIIEIPDASIREMVVWQRFFIHMLAEKLRRMDTTNGQINIDIDGDDIMVSERKLSVSIATLSRFSGLVHVGLNIEVGRGCPVAAIGLENIFPEEWKREQIEAVKEVASKFAAEYNDIIRATYKVREV